MEEYRLEIIKKINTFLSDYSHIATSDYLSQLVEIREYLLVENPLCIYYDESLISVHLDIERFTEGNQKYLNKVLKLKSYFQNVEED